MTTPLRHQCSNARKKYHHEQLGREPQDTKKAAVHFGLRSYEIVMFFEELLVAVHRQRKPLDNTAIPMRSDDEEGPGHQAKQKQRACYCHRR
jgi:hypothetical protein